MTKRPAAIVLALLLTACSLRVTRRLGVLRIAGQVLHVIQVGRKPHGLTYFPQPGRFSLGHNGVYR